MEDTLNADELKAEIERLRLEVDNAKKANDNSAQRRAQAKLTCAVAALAATTGEAPPPPPSQGGTHE